MVIVCFCPLLLDILPPSLCGGGGGGGGSVNSNSCKIQSDCAAFVLLLQANVFDLTGYDKNIYNI